MIGLDTNVVVRLLVNDDPDQTSLARSAVDRCTPEDPGYLTTVTTAEIYWVLRRGYRLPVAEVLSALRRVVTADNVRVERAREVGRALDLAESGADFADSLIDSVSRADGCTGVVTFDRGASDRLGWERLTGTE